MNFSTELKKIEEKYKEDCDKLKAKFDDDVAKLRSQIGLKQFPNIFNPKRGEAYYALTENGWVEPVEWSDCSYDQDVYQRGLAFTSEEEADFEDECRLFRFEFESFIAANDPRPITEKDWEDTTVNKCFLFYDHKYKVFDVATNTFIRYANQVYASSEEIIEKAVEHFGEKKVKKYYFKIKN